mgnify:CR=1 FL=1
MAKTLAFVSTAATLATTVYSAYQQNKASKARKKENALSRRIQDVQAARERRKLVGQARVARAQATAQAEGAGAGSTSGAVIGTGTISTQAGTGVSFLNTVQDLTNQKSIFSQQAASAGDKANLANSANGVFQKYASLYKG